MVETVLITGATGTVGSEIIRQLASVTLIDPEKSIQKACR